MAICSSLFKGLRDDTNAICGFAVVSSRPRSAQSRKPVNRETIGKGKAAYLASLRICGFISLPIN